MAERRPNPLRGLPSQPGGPTSRHEGPTPRPSTYASYRDAVSGLMQAHEPFDEVEEAIDASDLDEDMRAALWLLAFSMRAPRRRPRGAPRHALPIA